MNYTENYQLNQWEPTDRVLREDFNSDNAKLETALSEMAAQMAGFGNCRMAVGSYVGSGGKGPSSPVTLTFDFSPKFLFVRGENYATSLYGFSGWFLWCAGGDMAKPGMAGGSTSYPNVITANGNTISWYNGYDAGYQLNAAQQTYYYVALG